MKICNQFNFRRCLFSILLFGLISLLTYSQETGSCAEKLANAQALFDRGQVGQIPGMLSECLKSGFNREESLAAYKLLIQVYLFDDNLEIADSTMLDFLKKNPEYQLSPTDHSSFVHLFNTFNVKPIVQITIHIGTNIPFVTFVNKESTASELGKNSYNSEALNLFASVEAKFEISNKLELNFEAGYSQIAFTNIKGFMGYEETNYTEKQSRLELPISATYSFKDFGKFTLYGRLGAGAAVSLSSSSKTFTTSTDLNGAPSLTGSDITRKDFRAPLDFFIQTGAGIKYKTPGGYISAELRSNLGILNQTILKEASFTGDLPFYYKYIDNDFHINAMNFSLGYTLLFYKPSKIQSE